MSVKVCDRTQGKLESLTKAMEFAAHTIRICDNDNVFPKRHRLSVVADIIKEVKLIAKLINRANKKDLEKNNIQRRKLQDLALDTLDDVEIDMEIAYRTIVANFPEKKLDYWLQLLLEVRSKVKAWIRADAEKLKTLSIKVDN